MNMEDVETMLSIAVNFLIDFHDAISPPLASTPEPEEAPKPTQDALEIIECHGKSWHQDTLPIVTPVEFDETVIEPAPIQKSKRRKKNKPKRCTIWSPREMTGNPRKIVTPQRQQWNDENKNLKKHRSSCCETLGRHQSGVDGFCASCRFLSEEELKELVRQNRRENR